LGVGDDASARALTHPFAWAGNVEKDVDSGGAKEIMVAMPETAHVRPRRPLDGEVLKASVSSFNGDSFFNGGGRSKVCTCSARCC
jgi:hypothetical protein